MTRISSLQPDDMPRLLLLIMTSLFVTTAAAQESGGIRYGSAVSPEVERVYERGLQYLVKSQQSDGSWPSSQQGGGITGLCVMALLAHGEDPNFGPYSMQIRRGLQHLLQSQNKSTGFIPSSMYHHGFATLALAEAYGVVDESQLWEDGSAARPTIASGLELAVRCAITSQKGNQWGGWRYSPGDNNADTSVSGAVLVGLLAARNAGIEIPDEAIDRALTYYRSSTSDMGMVAYSGGIGGHGESMNRSAIATLVFAVGKRREWQEYQAALGYITSRLDHQEQSYPLYFRYYMAQALFQGDFEAWNTWKSTNARALQTMQLDDGSFASSHGGPAYGTAMALLSLAVEYRFLPIYER